MTTTVTYKGATLTTVDNQTRTLTTSGKYLEDNITLTDVSGGGSSDFSIATVSFVLPVGNYTGLGGGAIIVDNDQLSIKTEVAGEESVSMVLYKGVQNIMFEDSAQFTASTNVEILSEDYYDGTWGYEIAIKGDCELHITGWSEN